MSFHVGQKVVCVDDKEPDHGWVFFTEPFVKGRIYVVRLCRMGIFPDGSHRPAICVFGIYGKMAANGQEWAISTHRFRPLEELQQESKERYYAEHPIHA